MKIRWPFKKLSYQHWLGINLSKLNPSAVIYSEGEISAAISFNAEEGLAALTEWLKENLTDGMPAVLVLDDDDYELVLTEAPNVPDAELSAAMEFRIADLLAQDINETAIQAIRLPDDAYRGRMSMAHVIAASNQTIEHWVEWTKKLKLNLSLITVPELCLLNLLALLEIEQGIGLLELGPKKSCLRLYQEGALYLTRQVEVGLDALELVTTSNSDEELEVETLEVEALEIDSSEIVSDSDEELDLELSADLEIDTETDLIIEAGIDLESASKAEGESENDTEINIDEYVSFAGKEKVNEQQLQNLILDVQRSLDYYESQLGMGQITRLWLMSGDEELAELVEIIAPRLSARIEQPNIGAMLKEMNFQLGHGDQGLNSSAIAIGGAAAHAGR